MVVSIPVSSLTNYNAVLSEVDRGNEVVLTKNGHSKYAVVDIETWQHTTSMLRFLSDMRSVDEEMAAGGKWHTQDEVLCRLGLPAEDADAERTDIT
ncbi:MAG: prevent-host-death protein [Coriobacteriia bacterium]|nr:prevent-host-death protein [Coriobacteriia bacterium]